MNISITGQGNASCTVSASDYDCTINYTGVQTSLTANLNALFTGYIGGWKRNPPGACSDPPSSSETIQAGRTLNWPIYFAITPWMKMQDGSLQTPGISFTMPPNPQKFQTPAGSPTDNGDQVLIDDQNGGTTGAGVAGTNGSGFPQGIGPPPPLHLSQNNWQPGANGAYNWPMNMDQSAFFTYVKSRKQYQTLGSGNLSGLGNGIFYTSNNSLSLTNEPAANVSAIIIAPGNVTIGSNITRSSLAIIAGGTITIANSVGQVNAVLIASSVDAGSSSTPLYINGNLISNTAINLNRNISNNLIPTVFIQINPQTYLNLLPLLSIDTYDWTQLQ